MEWLNFHHLRYFWIVSKEGSLARAAELLHVSQPSISGQIRELEQALGQRLFRREGRKNVLTEVGQVVHRYAAEIFSLGGELLNAVNERPTESALRVHVGLTDSFPKLLGNEILKPLFGLGRPVHVICREGKLDDLLVRLAAHQLDIVLADESPPSGAAIHVHDHKLGETETFFCATKKLSATLVGKFPQSLNQAPALLPLEHSPLRRAAETWFRGQDIRPRVVAEFEDPALMKVMAAEGRGFVVLPTASAGLALKRYRLEVLGKAADCRVSFHALTAVRQVEHPAVAAITRNKAWMSVGF